jgi:hypothetical protein
VSAGPASAVTDLSAEAGELSFTARVGESEERLWLRGESVPAAPSADPALATTLMPAMTRGGELRIDEALPLSARLLRNQAEWQAVHRSWSKQWPFGLAPLQEVEVSASSRPAEAPAQDGRVATFFSGGVDSWAALLDNPDVTDLVFARGLDLVPGWPQHEALADEVEARLREAADELGLTLHVVDTNVRTFSDPQLRWETYAPSVLAAIALLFAPLFERVLIATDLEHDRQIPLGAARLVDHLWSTEELEVVDWGGRFSRTERLARIAGHPLVQRTLRVCWENRDGAYNCGRCGKCLLTMIPLEAIGTLEAIETFPELDLRHLDGYTLTTPLQVVLWEDVLEATERADRPDLSAPVAAVVESGHRAIGGAEQELREVLGSSSWRLTAPLRRLGRLRRR